MKDEAWFRENEDRGESTYYRGRDMETPLKVVGINNSGVEDKVFWAAFDNREGLRDGSITNYDQLYLRPFKRYEAPMYETARVYKTISYIPKINAFSSEDAENNIMYDEDGAFHSGEWYDEPGYEESDDDWETTDGPNSDGDIKQIGIVYDEQQGLNESLIKEMGPSPEENDIMSELNDLVQSWEGCEEGMPVACRYKNQVQELIDKGIKTYHYENSIKKIKIREEVEVQNKELITEGALDKLQTALGVAGVVFDPADALNAVISFFRQKMG